MPRPTKCRRVCQMPQVRSFLPEGASDQSDAIILNVDEYETIRLIDQVGLSQEECGSYMQIARTTVQQIYTSARKKLAQALVEGIAIRIEGGHYRLCGGDEGPSCCDSCPKRNHSCQNPMREEHSNMKIAIPLDENKTDVCPTFARAPYFLFSENGAVEVLANPAADAASGAGLQAAQFLMDQNVSVILTPRCGQNSADVFQAAGTKIYKTQGSNALENIVAFQQGALSELTHFHAGYHGIR